MVASAFSLQKTVVTVVVFLDISEDVLGFLVCFFLELKKEYPFFLKPEICEMFNEIWISAAAVAGQLVSCYKMTDSKATSLLWFQDLCKAWQWYRYTHTHVKTYIYIYE